MNEMNDFSIVLLRPEIPHNTGAIGHLFKIPMPGEHARALGRTLKRRGSMARQDKGSENSERCLNAVDVRADK